MLMEPCFCKSSNGHGHVTASPPLTMFADSFMPVRRFEIRPLLCMLGLTVFSVVYESSVYQDVVFFTHLLLSLKVKTSERILHGPKVLGD